MEKNLVSDALFVATKLLDSLCDIIASYAPLCSVRVLLLQKEHLMLWDSMLCVQCHGFTCNDCSIKCFFCRRIGYCQNETCMNTCHDCKCFVCISCTEKDMWKITFHHINDYPCESRLCMEKDTENRLYCFQCATRASQRCSHLVIKSNTYRDVRSVLLGNTC